VLHLAVAMGLPTVALFRDYADADAWAPAGAAHRVFRLPCECVNRRDGPCTADGQARCLARLEPACVEQAILELLDGDKPLASAPGALL
jgi:ADP-heptose:LPS heptosyltransferase